MNKRQFIKMLCASAIIIVMGGCSHTYPPSKYIGIFDYYDGCENGALPFDGSYFYSGAWSALYPQSKQIKVQGTYLNGKPDGKWKCFYRNGELQFFAIYSYGQREQMISYYPDGVPCSVSRSDKYIKYNPDGSLYVCSDKKINSSAIFAWNHYFVQNIPKQISHFYESEGTSVYAVLYPEVNGRLDIWCYIVSEEGISKIKISSILSNETGLLKDIEYDMICGKIKALLSSKEENKILKMTLLLENDQIKKYKLLVDIPLMYKGESSTKDGFISYSFQ